MSKPIKELIRKVLIRRFEGVTSLAVVGFAGLDAIATNNIRGRLKSKDISFTVVKNSLAKQAFRQVGLERACDLLDGPCALAWGSDSVVSVVRELLDIAKESPALVVKAALLEDEVFGSDRVDELSKFPTRDEAIANIVAIAMSPARKLAGCLTAPGGAIAGILKTIEENQSDDQDIQTDQAA